MIADHTSRCEMSTKFVRERGLFLSLKSVLLAGCYGNGSVLTSFSPDR